MKKDQLRFGNVVLAFGTFNDTHGGKSCYTSVNAFHLSVGEKAGVADAQLHNVCGFGRDSVSIAGPDAYKPYNLLAVADYPSISLGEF